MKGSLDKKPQSVVLYYGEYLVVGLKLNEYWMQPIRKIYRSRSKYVPHQNLREKERRLKKYVEVA